MCQCTFHVVDHCNYALCCCFACSLFTSCKNVFDISHLDAVFMFFSSFAARTMFLIVEWVNSDPSCVSIVPSNWLVSVDNKLWSYWSPTRRADESLIKKQREPDLSWPKYEVKMLGKAGRNYNLSHYHHFHA